mgnify:FL=1
MRRIGQHLPSHHRAVQRDAGPHRIRCRRMEELPALLGEQLQTAVPRTGPGVRAASRCERRPHLRGVAEALRARGASGIEGHRRVRRARNGQAALLLRHLRHGVSDRRAGPPLGSRRGGRLRGGGPHAILSSRGRRYRALGGGIGAGCGRSCGGSSGAVPVPQEPDGSQQHHERGHRRRTLVIGALPCGRPLRKRGKRACASWHRAAAGHRRGGWPERPRMRRQRAVGRHPANGGARRRGKRGGGRETQSCGTCGSCSE